MHQAKSHASRDWFYYHTCSKFGDLELVGRYSFQELCSTHKQGGSKAPHVIVVLFQANFLIKFYNCSSQLQTEFCPVFHFKDDA